MLGKKIKENKRKRKRKKASKHFRIRKLEENLRTAKWQKVNK